MAWNVFLVQSGMVSQTGGKNVHPHICRPKDACCHRHLHLAGRTAPTDLLVCGPPRCSAGDLLEQGNMPQKPWSWKGGKWEKVGPCGKGWRRKGNATKGGEN
ncbi:hypothetical protein E2C01_093818 [Portunus trituberculatus]|uniref:Uncharacterized protein n=1 Tax=Portunus trituberculatus TaxID=210409 RepID=A0A5B7JZ60_PORTR|nr:hypothetical protein [Portunus trituberculatus]